ncbi:MAG: hypothetical protein M3Y90_17325 [Actinomycetota bacterium]|nr:hypothetical protein [Actinomycetota bacterium]
MSGIVWQLPGADAACGVTASGHQIPWHQFLGSMRTPGRVIAVTASVDDDGRVYVEGDGLSLVRWNHDPALLRSALEHFGGTAEWKPSWGLLAVPAAVFMGSQHTVFSLAKLDKQRKCRAPVPADTRDTQTIWAEQEARNAAIRAMDFSDIPPLRLADRYAGGRPRRTRHG